MLSITRERSEILLRTIRYMFEDDKVSIHNEGKEIGHGADESIVCHPSWPGFYETDLDVIDRFAEAIAGAVKVCRFVNSLQLVINWSKDGEGSFNKWHEEGYSEGQMNICKEIILTEDAGRMKEFLQCQELVLEEGRER